MNKELLERKEALELPELDTFELDLMSEEIEIEEDICSACGEINCEWEHDEETIYCPEPACPECEQEECVCDRDIEEEPREPDWEEEYE